MSRTHWLMIGVIVVIAGLLYANKNCASCKQQLTAISNAMGNWPGAGAGVQNSRDPDN